jgi:hypothetical protein
VYLSGRLKRASPATRPGFETLGAVKRLADEAHCDTAWAQSAVL